MLVAEFWPKKVTERDRTGKVLWEKTLTNHPVSCQRLPNGNTFVAISDALLELSPAGKEVYRIAWKEGRIYDAENLPDGSIVCIDINGTVMEYDSNLKEVRRFKPSRYAEGAAFWAGVQKLADGKYLLSLTGSKRVVETDATGKILWETAVKDPTWATRLSNGHTLITSTDRKCVVELDAAGKEVWKVPVQHRLFRARRY